MNVCGGEKKEPGRTLVKGGDFILGHIYAYHRHDGDYSVIESDGLRMCVNTETNEDHTQKGYILVNLNGERKNSRLDFTAVQYVDVTDLYCITRTDK